MLRTLKIALGNWLCALPARGANAADSARRGAPTGSGPRLAVVGVVIAAAIAYRSLAVWDPGARGLPGIGWFVFGISDTAPQIVFAIVAGLLFRRRARIVRALGGPRSPLLGVGAVSASLVLFVWGRHTDAPEFLVLSLACFVLGSALFIFGRRVARELGSPLLVLIFALPIPGIVLNHILLPMQVAAAVQLAWLLDAVGITVVREGVVLHLADRAIEVIETCSGLRGISILTMLAVCWAVFFSMRPLAACILVVSAPLIALAVNAVRLLSVSLNPYSDLASGHAVQGVAVFMAGIALLCGVDAMLRYSLGSGGRAEVTSPASSGARPRLRSATLPTLVALALLAASIWLPIWQQATPERTAIELPSSVGEWRLREEKLPVNGLFLGRALVPDHVHRRYEKGGEQVTVFVARDHRRDRSRSVLSPKTGLPGPDWSVEERYVRSLGPESFDAGWLVARSNARRVAVLHWYEGVEGLGTEMVRACLAMDRSALRRPCSSVAVRLQTEQSGGSDDERRAGARLLELADALRPYLAGLACAGSDAPELSLEDSSRTPSIPNWKKGALAAGWLPTMASRSTSPRPRSSTMPRSWAPVGTTPWLDQRSSSSPTSSPFKNAATTP
jgi:EpsI family protein